MFARDKVVTADGVFKTEAEALDLEMDEEVQYRSTANFPIYRCKCLGCSFYAENIADLKLAEQTAKNHAEQYRHRVRLAMDLVDIEIEIINGEEQEAHRG